MSTTNAPERSTAWPPDEGVPAGVPTGVLHLDAARECTGTPTGTRNKALHQHIRGAPGRTRTCGLPLRRRSLYPPELRGRAEKRRARSTAGLTWISASGRNHCGGQRRTRTHPRQAPTQKASLANRPSAWRSSTRGSCSGTGSRRVRSACRRRPSRRSRTRRRTTRRRQ
jgi:hypothetical protein